MPPAVRVDIPAALRKLRAMPANATRRSGAARPNHCHARRVAVLMPSLTQWLWLMILLSARQPWRTMMVASDGDPCCIGASAIHAHKGTSRSAPMCLPHTRYGQPIVSRSGCRTHLRVAGRLRGLYGLVVVRGVDRHDLRPAHAFLLRETAITQWNFVRCGCLGGVQLGCATACLQFLFAALWCDALAVWNATRRFRVGVVRVLTLLWSTARAISPASSAGYTGRYRDRAFWTTDRSAGSWRDGSFGHSRVSSCVRVGIAAQSERLPD